MRLNIDTWIIRLVLESILAIFLSVGFITLAIEFLKFPYIGEKNNLSILTKNAVYKPSFIDNIVANFAKILKPLIRINDFKKQRLVAHFEILGIKKSVEDYYSEIAAKTILLAMFIPLLFAIHIVLGLLFAALVVLFCLVQINKIDEVMQKRKETIESELPKFVSVIEQTFKNDRDVIKLISTYVKNTDSPLSRELSITLADMRTGDFEVALNRMATRVDSVFLSETVRGLQSALIGDDTTSYFKTLSIKLWDNEKEKIKKKALKQPSKVKYLVKVMLICMFLIYIVVFGTVIYDGLHEVFEMM